MPDIAQLVFLAQNINSFNLEFLTSTGSSAIAAEVRKFISRCKDELISLTDLKNYINAEEKIQGITAEQINILKDVYKMFSAYEEYKNQQNMIDFGDMLFLVYNILCSKSKILERYQNKYQHVIVDEFQDTNFVQLSILHLITKQHKNICVVGDDDQSIYQSRGAYVTNIKQFKELFPTFKEVNLVHNYRSKGHILRVANEIIIGNPDREEKQLRAMNDMGNRIKVVECDNDTTQTIFLAEQIEDMLSHKILPKEIAVLCRSRSSGMPIANELKKRQIPVEFIGNPDYFAKPIIKDVISLLRIIQNPVLSNIEMVRILERDVFCLKRTDVAKLANLAHTKICSIYEAFEFIKDIDIDRIRFLKIKEAIDNLIVNKNKLNVGELIYQILFNNDFYKHELEFNNAENICYLNLFYEFVEDFIYLYPKGELGDFISYIDLASEFGIESENESRESVQIMTVHSAKGKEFENVFVVDATERKFPSVYRNDKFEIPRALLKGTRSLSMERDLHIQEERRIFYVALTRAKKQLVISYPKRYQNNITDSLPSRFLMNIDYKNNFSIDFENMEKGNIKTIRYENDYELPVIKELVADIRADRFLEAIHKVLFIAKGRSANVKDIIENVIEPNYVKLQNDMILDLDYSKVENKQMEFSASQFSTYERCPRIYLYHYIYKIPTKPKSYFDFGATVHKVIEELSKRMQQGEIVDREIASEILMKS